MDFVKCKEEQFDAVYRFYCEVIRHLENTVNYPKWNDDHPSREGITEAIKSGELYLCLDSGEILGAVMLGEDPEGDYEAVGWSVDLIQGEYLTIHLFAVHPSCGRRGIGSFMVQECIKKARADGYKAIRLDTVPDNHPANGLYLKNGFSYVETKDIHRGIPAIPVFNLYELNL